jgi:hypothetical protein
MLGISDPNQGNIIVKDVGTRNKKEKKLRKIRIPIPRPGNTHRDKSKYTRKVKHKKRIDG